MWTRMLSLLGAAVGCTSGSDTVILTVENRCGAELWYLDYAECGSDDWYFVIASDEYVPDGADASSVDLSPGCFDAYVEDEFACWAQSSTGNVAGGYEWTWTVLEDDLTCP